MSNQSLSALLGRQNNPPILWGVVRDTDCLDIPAGVSEIGFVAEIDESGEISPALMDVVIAYRVSKRVAVTLELSIQQAAAVSPNYAVNMARSLDCSLALLPPSTAEELVAYQLLVVSFTKELLAQKNFIRNLFPVTGFISYMMAETAADLSAFVPTDPYVLERFHKVMSREDSDAYKAKIRAAVHEHFGGEADFRFFAEQLLRGVKLIHSLPQPTPEAVC